MSPQRTRIEGPIFSNPSYVSLLQGRNAAITVTALLIAVVWCVHLQILGTGGIEHYDEFYTLDRSASFLRRGDWLTVYSGNEASFKKPPLQYWLTALLLKGDLDTLVALRLPSMLFALGSLAASALFAAVVLPKNLWVMPAAVLFYASSERFWENATSAMLDAGATFFALLALTSALIALRRPPWWYVTGLAIGLGALQKAPIALVLVAGFLLLLGLSARWHGHSFGTFLRNRPFQRGMGLAIVLTLAWPLLQLLQHGTISLVQGYGEQMIDRFTPAKDGSVQRSLFDVLKHIVSDEVPVRGLGLIALFVLPWRLKRFDLLPLTLLILIYMCSVAFASGYVSHRYALIFVPYLSVALAATIVALQRPERLRAGLVVLISLLQGGPINSANDLDIIPDAEARLHIELLSKFAVENQNDADLAFCFWDRDTRMPPGAISYYASNGRTFHLLGAPEDVASLNGPLRGLCTTDEVALMSAHLKGLQTSKPISNYVTWSAEGVE